MPVRRGARFRSRLLVRPTRPGNILPGVEAHNQWRNWIRPAKAGITGRVTDSRVIAVKSIEKYFPPALSGWRALLQPVAKPTERALSGVSFSVGAGEAVALIGAGRRANRPCFVRDANHSHARTRYTEPFRCRARLSRILKLLYPSLLVNHCRLQYSFCQAPKGGRQ